MRKIKFKVWCKNKNEWETDLILLDSYGNLIHRNRKGLETVVSPETHIVVFYIGLKDKNGKEIYEEDIIRIEHRKDSFIEIVQYRQEVCAFETNMKRGLGISESFYPNYEIIGNIYENPELLKK